MRSYAHIVNPVVAGRASDLHVAQPITFESMRVARAFSGAGERIKLMTAQFAEDHAACPADFVRTHDLDRSILDLGTFLKPRKLPLLRDILDRVVNCSDAEYLIYTNVDIAVLPGFYRAVDQMIDAGFDALVINRRTISDRHTTVAQLPLMYAEVGQKHPGHDCFVFRRDQYAQYELGDVCIGMAWVAKPLLLNMAYFAERFHIFEDFHLTFHVGDPRPWTNLDFADYRRHNRDQFMAVKESLRQKHGVLASRLKPGVTVPPMFEERPPWYTRLAQRVLPAGAYAVAKRMYRTVNPVKEDA
jgi:hypothetical protein